MNGKGQSRSAVTRLALLDAALECHQVEGFARVTTTDIAQCAGVSRGALLHHFPTKGALLIAAVDHLLARRVEEFRAGIEAGLLRFDRLDEAVDVLWSMFAGPAAVVWAELWVAARTNPDLREKMLDVDVRFTNESTALALQFLEGDPELFAVGELLKNFAFALMTGLAMKRLVSERIDLQPVSDCLDAFKRMIPTFLQRPLEH